MGLGGGGWGECLCVVFWLTGRSRVRGGKKKKGFGASYSTNNELLLVARHILTAGLQKVGSIKYANSVSPPSIVKKVRTGSKSSQGT